MTGVKLVLSVKSTTKFLVRLVALPRVYMFLTLHGNNVGHSQLPQPAVLVPEVVFDDFVPTEHRGDMFIEAFRAVRFLAIWERHICQV